MFLKVKMCFSVKCSKLNHCNIVDICTVIHACHFASEDRSRTSSESKIGKFLKQSFLLYSMRMFKIDP